ncbi:Ltp family lipoprotein [Staphylococcus arlettae]|uniref:Ltp family lipoprotein n=1 Tax=Staphylococcus arlettae TaxID=29378 RepID=UPI001E2F1C0B|nr:Ltp family lipoprotein [Staphylococcus arlettae]MCD9055044.1 Ltp family lipoprotein [Staphylococcus arlettae]
MATENKELTNEELLARQQQQFEEYKEQEKKGKKKKWFWGCGGCLVFMIIMGIIFASCSATVVNEVDKEINDGTAEVEKDNDASKEQQAALNSAKTYADTMHMSKKGIFDQLTADAGDQFSEEDAQYAVDHLKADYKENALKSAESYQEDQNMSKDRIYDQLTSSYGDKFTEEEAQYAVDNLEE